MHLYLPVKPSSLMSSLQRTLLNEKVQLDSVLYQEQHHFDVSKDGLNKHLRKTNLKLILKIVQITSNKVANYIILIFQDWESSDERNILQIPTQKQ